MEEIKMVDEKWYKCATYDYSEQAKKLYSDLKAKGMSEEDIDSVIWDVARHLFPCDPCEEHLGEAMVFLFADEVSAEKFMSTLMDVKTKKLMREIIEEKVDVLDRILNMSSDDITKCTNKLELVSLILHGNSKQESTTSNEGFNSLLDAAVASGNC